MGDVTRLSIPGQLRYRGLALSTVEEATRWAGAGEEFEERVVSAFGEAFNHVVLHAYGEQAPGDLEVEVHVAKGQVTIRVADQGRRLGVPDRPDPELADRPDSTLGLGLLRAWMDEVAYEPGPWNVLTMTKRCPAALPVVEPARAVERAAR